MKNNRKVQLNCVLIEHTPNPQRVVASAARLCYSDSDFNTIFESISGEEKFVKLLKDMGHLSTFEHISFSFSVSGVSRALLAQITRHRIASFSVRSQRYVSEGDFNFIVPPSISNLGKKQEDKFVKQMETISSWYKDWQTQLGGKNEKSNEDARFVLPNACETNFILTMNARELLHFFSLRLCFRAQWEIRELAKKMLTEVIKVAPAVFEGAYSACISRACPEGKKTCGKAHIAKKEYEEIIGGLVK